MKFSLLICSFIMLHNIDMLGADVSPDAIGHHIIHTNALTFEVIPRRIEDRGGGLLVSMEKCVC
jgi:UDP-N-acetylglucosamine pyrophosphorylase